MFNFLKQNKSNHATEKATPGNLSVLNKPSGSQTGEIEEGQLDQVSGGINPQPFPPRRGEHHEFPIF